MITAVYNGEKYLSEAIKSVLCQTYRNFEYIIVNDGSTDNTQKIIEKFALKDKRIKNIYINNSGPAIARNKALEIAAGDWIAILDSDDMNFPDRLQIQAEFAERHPESVLIGGDCIEINSKGNIIKKHRYPSDHKSLIYNLENSGKFFPHSSSFYKKKCKNEIFNYNARFTPAEDFDLFLRMSKIGKIRCINKSLIKLRKHQYSLSKEESGNLIFKIAIASYICHYRHGLGLSDPSKMDENFWQNFLTWIEKRIVEQGYFYQKQAWLSLRDILYSQAEVNRLKKGLKFLEELIQNPWSRKALWMKFWKSNPSLKLAKESKIVFN